jgi:hypothetical protein
MLETIREFAAERLAADDDAARIRDAHAQHVIDIARNMDRSLLTSEAQWWLERLTAGRSNLDVALDWLAQRGDAESLLTLASSTWWEFWERGHVREVCGWLDRGLSMPGPVSAATRARATASAASAAWYQGDNAEAEELARMAVEMSLAAGLELPAGLAFVTLMLAAMERGEFARALEVGEEALPHLRRSGNQ